MEQIEKAKEIFFSHNGQFYHIAHDGMYDEYKRYNIDEIVEKQWAEELISLRLNEYKETSDFRYLMPLAEYYNRYDMLNEILTVKLKGDYLNKLVVIELLTGLLCKNKDRIDHYNDKRKTVIQFYDVLKNENIPDEYIRKGYYKINERLEEINKQLCINYN
jgi:hypothetical protein